MTLDNGVLHGLPLCWRFLQQAVRVQHNQSKQAEYPAVAARETMTPNVIAFLAFIALAVAARWW